MSWDVKHQHFEHDIQRHYAVLHDPTTGAEHHVIIYTGHDSCPTCGHVKPKTNTGEIDLKAIIKEELANLEQSHQQSAAFVKKHNLPVAKVTR